LVSPTSGRTGRWDTTPLGLTSRSYPRPKVGALRPNLGLCFRTPLAFRTVQARQNVETPGLALGGRPGAPDPAPHIYIALSTSEPSLSDRTPGRAPFHPRVPTRQSRAPFRRS